MRRCHLGLIILPMIPAWLWAVECPATPAENGVVDTPAVLQADCGPKKTLPLPEGRHKTNSRTSSLPPYNHDNPAILNEYALRYWLPKGDLETAHILLARAVRLDPSNQKIRANLDQIDRLQSDISGKSKIISFRSFAYSYTNLDAKPKSSAAPQTLPLGWGAGTAPSPSLWPILNKQ
ncbi:MAG: hypothetical protein GJU73_11900 [Ferrovum sp.]|jgi:hypothetical protein|nr:hypothetical protein [Ferrovum sp.]